MGLRTAVLSRFETGDQGTFGRLVADGLSLFTGELPWRNNEPSISCLPPEPGGEPIVYTAAFNNSPRFGRSLYLLAPTDPRAGIRVHPANLMGDSMKGLKCQLNGCIALGERLGWIEGQKAVLLSAQAVRKLEEHFGGRSFTLEIRNA